MRLFRKLPSGKTPAVTAAKRARVLLPVLFLLALPSCSVSKQLWIQNEAQQNSDAMSLAAVDRSSTGAGGGNNTVISNTRTQDGSLGESASTAQQSDINGKTSPDISSNGVAVLNLPALAELKAVNVQPSEILGVFPISSNAGRVLSVNRDGAVYLWDLQNQRSFELLHVQAAPLEVAAVNEAGLLLAVGHENTVTLYSLADGSEVGKLQKLKSRPASLSFQPSGRSLVIGAADGEVYRWRFVEERTATSVREKEKLFERYFGHSSVISAVAYHPVGRVFFSGDWSGALNAWLPYDADAFGGKYLENAFGTNMFSDRATRSRGSRASTASIEHLRVSADGEALLAAGQDGALEWWLVRGFTLAVKTPAHKGLIYDLGFSPSGAIAATLGRDGKIRTWSLTKTVKTASAETVYSLDKIKEIEAAGQRRLVFIDETTLAVGDQAGRISLLKL